MKFVELEQRAWELWKLRPEERDAELRQLVADARLASVVALALEQIELADEGSSQLIMADHPYCLAHAAGVRYGLRELLNRLAELLEPAPVTGMRPPKGK